jgi:hypothetical protein
MPMPINQALRFLNALFIPGDAILIRPIETWIDKESGDRKSRVDREGVTYIINGNRDNVGNWVAAPDIFRSRVERILARHIAQKTNLFFGCCPRVGGGGQFDQAWQIRTVRALWQDLDDCLPDEAVLRCEQKKIPPPSIVVGSGNGTHLYWLLAEPVAIDDCEPPPPVHAEYIEKNGKKRRRPYILDDKGEKLHLDVRANVPHLSPKAQHVQDILSGMAGLLGGDHTTDLSRILRIPGSLNQKDVRNGKESRPCLLKEIAVSCGMH